MKDVRLTGLLAAARSKKYAISGTFTDKVMESLQPSAIFTNQIRRMNVNKKETFIMKLKHLPKFAIIAIAIAALAVTGGTTYALYKALWERPSVTVNEPTTNQFGRTQVIASFENCSNQSDQTTFEIKRGSTLDPSEIGKILQARCEIEALREWSGANKSPARPDASIREAEGTSSASMVMVSPVASKIVSLDATSLTLTGDEYNTPKEPLTLTAQTQYIVDGQQVSADAIKSGDTVLYVYDQTSEFTTKKIENGYDTTSRITNEVTTGIIKVDLPSEYYGPGKQNQIAEREPCENNVQDSCVQTSAIVLYEDWSGSLQGYDDPNNLIKEYRYIQGVITEHNGATVTIQSSSGRTFTITTPTDVITGFNQTRSGSYNGITLGAGDLLMVRYIVDKTDDGLNLEGSEVLSVYVGLNKIQKGDPEQKY
jgi:hypothetical protein